MRMKMFLSVCLVLFIFSIAPAHAQQGFKATPIFKGSATVAGQPIEFLKTDKPEIVSLLIDLEPGGEVGKHKHFVSGYVYVMEGTITIEMEDGHQREFQAGQSFIESKDMWHNAKNLGKPPVKLLAVVFGEEGRSNIIRPEKK